MQLGFPLKFIYLTKFAKILQLYVFFKEKAKGKS